MDQVIKAKWVAALRSGKYTQTFSSLKNQLGHCCLGVLCEISHEETGFGIEENKQDTEDQVLGVTMRNWSGIDAAYGNDVTIHGTLDTLSAHNDGGKSFLEIADAIEEQL